MAKKTKVQRWKEVGRAEGIRYTCIEVLVSLGDVPQSRALLARDIGMSQSRISDCVKAIRAAGWGISGSSAEGYVLSTSTEQRAWLEVEWDRQLLRMGALTEA